MDWKDKKFEYCKVCQTNVCTNDPDEPHLCDKPIHQATVGDLTTSIINQIESRFKVISIY